MKQQPESLASKWDYVWLNYIAALRSGSKTRIEEARKAKDEVAAEIG